MNSKLRFPAGTHVALTGATGFVGRHLTARLLEAGARVTAFVRPSSDLSALRGLGMRTAVAVLDDVPAMTDLLRGCDTLFHVAGAVDFKDDWETTRRTNAGGTRNALAAAKRAGVRRFVHTSSIVALGASHRPEILDETATWNLESLRIPYVTTKREAEAAVRGEKGIETVTVNPACVIGAGDGGKSEFGALCKRYWQGRIPFRFSGGNNFVDVRDVAEGHLRAALLGIPGERYFLGSRNLTYKEFFRLLAETGGRKSFQLALPSAIALPLAWIEGLLTRPGKRPYLPRGQAKLMGLYFFATHSKAERDLGYRPRRIEQTLAEAHKSYFRKAA